MAASFYESLEEKSLRRFFCFWVMGDGGWMMSVEWGNDGLGEGDYIEWWGEELLREESLGGWANEANWHNRANSFI